MYQVPLKFAPIAPGCIINATRVIAVFTTDNYQVREAIKTEKRSGTLINAAGRSKVRSGIFMDNGTVIASPLTPTRIKSSIDKSDKKAPKGRPKKDLTADIEDDEDIIDYSLETEEEVEHLEDDFVLDYENADEEETEVSSEQSDNSDNTPEEQEDDFPYECY